MNMEHAKLPSSVEAEEGKPSNSKTGHLSEGDLYYVRSVQDEVSAVLDGKNLPGGQRGVVEGSIAETLTHLAIENETATFQLNPRDGDGRIMDDVKPEMLDSLDRLQAGRASVYDKLRILSDQDYRPKVRSLELARCHHFLGNDVESEEVAAWLVREGIANLNRDANDSLSSFHKLKIHDRSTNRQGEIDGIIVSVKENLYEDEAGLKVRHRRKAFLSVKAIEDTIEPYEGYGGTKEQQLIRLQRHLKMPKGSTLPADSSVISNIVWCINNYPESVLTSIYYAFRPELPQYGRQHLVRPLGEDAIRAS